MAKKLSLKDKKFIQISDTYTYEFQRNKILHSINRILHTIACDIER